MASRPCPEWSKPAIYQGGCGWSGLCIRPGFAQGVSLHPRSLSDHVSWPSLDPPTDRWLWHCQPHFFRPTCTVLITGPCRLRENGGQLSQALGHSRGGFSTKVHVRVDGLGNPLRFRLTGGPEHDVTQAEELIGGLDTEYVITDRAYDSNQFLESIIRSGAVPIIPPRSNRKAPHSYDEYLYRERHLVECFIGKIKHFRRIFSRFDKLANRYVGFLHFVGALIWLR